MRALAIMITITVLAITPQLGQIKREGAPMAHCNDDPPPCPGQTPCINGRCPPPPSAKGERLEL